MHSPFTFFLFTWALFLLVRRSIALENGLARTPPMGWMSWTRFLCQIDCARHPHSCINEQLYREHGDRLVADGYKAVGYDTIHVDDCWSERARDSWNRLVADRWRFPSGMWGLSSYLHSRGLKFGLYGDYGTLTCEKYPGTMGFEKVDADTFASWGVDYLKLDGCNSNYYQMETGYPLFGRYLNASGRPIVYSCSWPAYWADRPHLVKFDLISRHCNLWRNEADISSTWSSMLGIINTFVRKQDTLIPISGPGRWHDPDMLVIGNPGITEGMSRVQMSVWSIWSAPLIMSNDLRNIRPAFRSILQNTRVIAVDQDPMGRMGRMVWRTPQLMYFVKQVVPVVSGQFSYAVAIINYSGRPATASFMLSTLGLANPNGYVLLNLWTGAQEGFRRPGDWYQAVIPAQDAQMFKATAVPPSSPRVAPAEFHRRRATGRFHA
ncbi:Alpha-galactosidase [Aphelenchoides fujianensis]|nr:Alpha-galactosidase [Aphelenchoides fujianensis]